jgi:2-amino-4-hydroxy-6-hydroxymethyldihydropteridine diphosphokinase
MHRAIAPSHGNLIPIAFGGNLRACDEELIERFRTAQRTLIAGGCSPLARSGLYATPPLGAGRQQGYINAVALFNVAPPPAELLRELKKIERAHGRRYGYRWGPRVLDLDLLFHGSRVYGWPVHRRRAGILTLPHPELHRRGFVLVPLCDALHAAGRNLVHPALGLSIETLTTRAQASTRGIKRIAGPEAWSP